jgi:hypothetical protein
MLGATRFLNVALQEEEQSKQQRIEQQIITITSKSLNLKTE